VTIKRFFRRCDERRMIGEPEIIIRAHVENLATAGDADVRFLRGSDDAFGFVETLRPNFSECVGESLIEFLEHDFSLTKEPEDGQS
jgi:hypothetical protein